MQENHQLEQYFFDRETTGRLADLCAAAAAPCCLGTPSVARELHRRGQPARLLDVDARFAELPGFVHWDFYRPRPLSERFDLIVCDPPFSRVRLSQLFVALRTLVQGDFTTRLVLCHLERRQHDIQGALGAFGLSLTDIVPTYVSVSPSPADRIVVYANFPTSAA